MLSYLCQMSLMEKLFKAKSEKLQKNLEEGLVFLANNALRKEIVVLPSGLQYEILKHAEGVMPSAQDEVTCHYHGTLIDGKVFDSSVERGKPATFPLNKVISGWTEALQLMAIGSKWRIYLPPHLAYGEKQVGSHIAPNSSLIFEVELLGF